MSKKYLYGNLNQDVVRATYGGSTSDSLIINVDNDNMVISGEVKWDAALGEIAHKAYPGNKGAQNRQKIEELTLRLQAVQSELNILVNSTNEKISDIQLSTDESIEAVQLSTQESLKQLDKLRHDLEQLNVLLNEECDRAVSVETEIHEAISTTFTSLQSSIIHLETKVNELENVESLTSIETKIDNEIKRAQQEELRIENLVESALIDLTTQLTNVEKEIVDTSHVIQDTNTELDTVKTSLQHLVNSVSKLQQTTDSSVQTLSAATTQFQLRLDSVVVRLKDVEQQVTLVQTKVAELDKKQATLDNSIHDVQSQLEQSIATNERNLEAVERNLAAKIEDSDQEILDLNELLLQAETNLDNHHTRLEVLTLKLAEVDNQLKEIENAVSVDQITNKLQLISSDVSLLKSQYNQLLQESSTLQASLKLVTTDLVTANTQINTLGETTQTLIEKLDVTSENISNVSSAISLVEEQQSDLISTVTQNEEIFQDFLTSNSNTLEELYKNLTYHTQELDYLKHSDIQTAAQIEKISYELSNIITQLTPVESRVNEMEGVLLEIKRSIESLAAEDITEVVSKNSWDIENIQRSLEAHEDTFEHLRQQDITTLNELSKLNNDISSLASSVKLIQTLTEEATAQFNQKYNQLDTRLFIVEDSCNRLHSITTGYQSRLNTLDTSLTKLSTTVSALQKQYNILASINDTTCQKIENVTVGLVTQESLLQQEIDTRTQQWREILDKFDAEIARSSAADDRMQDDLTNVTFRITELQSDLTQLIEDLLIELQETDTHLVSLIEANEQLILTTESKLRLSISRLTDTVNAADSKLRADLDTLQKNSITKTYIDELVETLRKEIYTELETAFLYDFIDGGNAPI